MLRVTVVDFVARAPIANAVATMIGANGAILATGVSNQVGSIDFAGHTGGRLVLTVRKLGYTPVVADTMVLAGRDTASRQILMQRIPQFLAPVAIRGERESIRNATFSGMKIGTLGATVITPTQVDVALPGANDFTDIVSRNPSAGLSVDYQRKCVMSNRGDPPSCLPVIVDGLLLANANDVVPPEIVDYLAMVRGNEMGMLYGSIGEHGTVVIFSKRGPVRGPRQ